MYFSQSIRSSICSIDARIRWRSKYMWLKTAARQRLSGHLPAGRDGPSGRGRDGIRPATNVNLISMFIALDLEWRPTVLRQVNRWTHRRRRWWPTRSRMRCFNACLRPLFAGPSRTKWLRPIQRKYCWMASRDALEWLGLRAYRRRKVTSAITLYAAARGAVL